MYGSGHEIPDEGSSEFQGNPLNDILSASNNRSACLMEVRGQSGVLPPGKLQSAIQIKHVVKRTLHSK